MTIHLDAIASLLEQGAADSAVRLLRGAWEPEMPPERRVPLYGLWIRALCDTGEYQRALTLARRAVSEFPSELDLAISLGNVLDVTGEVEESRDVFLRACELDDSSALARFNLGAAYERLGDEQKAERCYREAVARDEQGQFIEANHALGALLRRGGRLHEAEELYASILEQEPLQVDALVEHGICLSDLGRHEEAFERFREALSQDPTHAPAWYNRAVTLYRTGDLAGAIEAMRSAQQLDPDNPLTLAVLGSWQLQDPESLDDALSMLYGSIERLIELHRQHQVNNAYASVVMEEVFDALWTGGRAAEAREQARSAARLDWITPHMLDTLNRADHGDAASAVTYRVIARACPEGDEPAAPPHWPADVRGFETDLAVVAETEDEARELTRAWLRAVEGGSRLHVDVTVTDCIRASDPTPDRVRPRGVARVESSRAWLRG